VTEPDNLQLAAPPPSVRRVAFLGTPDVAAVALRALAAAEFDIPLVISRPDRRRGRGGSLSPSPAKQAALDLGLTVTDRLDDLADLDASGQPVDLAVVVAYGRIIPMTLLSRVPMVNIHFSLLPRWRGAAPVERAILAGDTETGVCLMEVAEGLDEGGVYRRVTTPIGPDETADELRERLGLLGADLLVQALSEGLGPPTEQVGDVTYAAKLDRDEFRLDLATSAAELHRRVRVGRAWCQFRGRRLGVERAAVATEGADDGPDRGHGDAEPGTIIGTGVATGDGILELVEVKPEGKRAMPAADWLNGVQPQPGEMLS
jgi:methionyl-tRNA formyltransferase